jgi:hypothetical protein
MPLAITSTCRALYIKSGAVSLAVSRFHQRISPVDIRNATRMGVAGHADVLRKIPTALRGGGHSGEAECAGVVDISFEHSEGKGLVLDHRAADGAAVLVFVQGVIAAPVRLEKKLSRES